MNLNQKMRLYRKHLNVKIDEECLIQLVRVFHAAWYKGWIHIAIKYGQEFYQNLHDGEYYNAAKYVWNINCIVYIYQFVDHAGQHCTIS